MFRATVWTAIALWAAVAAAQDSPEANQAADQFDGRWHVYELPRVTQRGDGTLDEGYYNPSVSDRNGKKRHPFGQPNGHAPWLHPGGVLGDRRSELVVVRSVRWPAGKGPVIYKSKGELPENYTAPRDLWSWHFPAGTSFRVELFAGGGRFAVHEVEKSSDSPTVDAWEENHSTAGDYPTWYSPPADCRKCHESAGRHARILEPKTEDYYHWLRGSADGRFSWHPFAWDRAGATHQEAVIRPALRRFVVASP